MLRLLQQLEQPKSTLRHHWLPIQLHQTPEVVVGTRQEAVVVHRLDAKPLDNLLLVEALLVEGLLVEGLLVARDCPSSFQPLTALCLEVALGLLLILAVVVGVTTEVVEAVPEWVVL